MVHIKSNVINDTGTMNDVIVVINGLNLIFEGARECIEDKSRENTAFYRASTKYLSSIRLKTDNIEVTMREDFKALSSVPVPKISEVLNTDSSKAMPCVDFLGVIHSIIAYYRTL